MKKAGPFFRIFILLLFLIRAECRAQYSDIFGFTNVHNYTHTDYGGDPQNWAIVQAPNGMIYVGNTDGILEFDGKEWEVIRIAKQSRVRSLAVTEKGWVYVGAAGEIGVLRPTPQGKMVYTTLVNFLPKNLRDLGEVWRTFVVGNHAYFQVEDHIIRINLHTDKPVFKFLKPETSFHNSFSVKGSYFVRQRKVGLQKLNGDRLQLVPGGEKFAGTGISEIIPLKSGKMLIATRIDGLYVYDGKDFTPFAAELKPFFSEHQVYDAELLYDDRIALATLDYGIVIINKKGIIEKVFNKSNGLNDNNVWYLFTDREKMLWACLESGLARIDVTGAYTVFNEVNGLPGDAVAVKEHKGWMYVGSSQGVFYQPLSENQKVFKVGTNLNKTAFFQVEGLFNRCYGFEEVNGELLVANGDGIFRIDKNTSVSICKGYAYSLLKLNSFPNRLLVGTDNGVEILDISRKPYSSLGYINGVQGEIRSILEDGKGQIWLITAYNGVMRLRITSDLLNPARTQFGLSAGLSSLDQNCGMIYKGKVLFGTPKGLFEFDESRNRFIPSPIQPKDAKIYTVSFLTADKHNNIWVTAFKTAGLTAKSSRVSRYLPVVVQLIPEGNEKFKANYLNLSGIPTSLINHIFIPNDSLLYLGMPTGLTRFRIQHKRPESPPFQVFLRDVTFNDSITDFGPKNHSEEYPEQQTIYSNAEFTASGKLIIKFRFGAATYQDPVQTHFQYRLENYRDEWSDWQKENYCSFSGLSAGTYRFYLRAINGDGKISNEIIYVFSLKNPWYLRWWMMTFYFLSGLSLLGGIYSFAEYRSRKEKRILEEKVAERTAEVLSQKKDLERQNLAITDSIQYAKRIQQAILPESHQISQGLPRSFIYYRPREIVSGDFYFFQQKEDCIIIAAVDCTGHGVPGAFMSVLGNSLLDQIINDHDVLMPDEILTGLNIAVVAALKQQSDHTDLLDGMDIALLAFFPEKKKAYFAGANRPMVYFREGKVIEVKGDKFSIGGRQISESENKSFTLKEFDLKSGDRFYIYTDGISDQFGGTNKQKFFNKRVIELLSKIQPHPMIEQEYDIDFALTEWQGRYRQTDDMLMIGIEWID